MTHGLFFSVSNTSHTYETVIIVRLTAIDGYLKNEWVKKWCTYEKNIKMFVFELTMKILKNFPYQIHLSLWLDVVFYPDTTLSHCQ